MSKKSVCFYQYTCIKTVNTFIVTLSSLGLLGAKSRGRDGLQTGTKKLWTDANILYFDYDSTFVSEHICQNS